MESETQLIKTCKISIKNHKNTKLMNFYKKLCDKLFQNSKTFIKKGIP